MSEQDNTNRVKTGAKPQDDYATFLKQLVDAMLFEQRRERRSRNVRFIFIAVALIFGPVLYLGVLASIAPKSEVPEDGYVALVRIQGEIMPGSRTSARTLNPLLADAFADTESAGVLILIDSPGGTPTQSSLIHDRILTLREKYPDRKVVVYAEDMLASGAYMIAAASPTIYATNSTLTGSIGVIFQGFGFKEAAERFGVEPRIYTAGDNKARLNPFAEVSDVDETSVRNMLEELHQQFIDVVRAGRGERLQADEASLFNGDIWTGARAKTLGLIDDTADLHTAMIQEFGTSYVREYRPKRTFSDLVRGDLGVVAGLLRELISSHAGYEGPLYRLH
jgi:protease IV